MRECNRKVFCLCSGSLPRMKYTNRLLSILFILVGITLANLLGIIQFNSNKVVIYLYPLQFDSNSEFPATSALSLDLRNDHRLGLGTTANYRPFPEAMRANISRLFVAISKFKSEIRAGLTQAEVVAAIELEEKFRTLIAAFQREQRKEYREDNPLKKDTNGKVLNDTDYEDLELITKLDEDNYVERTDFIKLIKLEKYRRGGRKFVSVGAFLGQFNVTQFLANETELQSYWNKYFFKINELRLYNDPLVLSEILEMMATSKVTAAREKERGTQIKVLMTLENGVEVLVKPMK